MGIVLTDSQNRAKNKVKKWFTSKTKGNLSDRVFTIGGLAGSGKSTMVATTIMDLGLDDTEVVYVAYTGMAASVLLRKGNRNAMTIHKLIYNTIPIEKNGVLKGFDFQLKDELDNPSIKLIVVDEVSMVNESMMNDLMSFNIKIMALGDPGQLPPIFGGNKLLDKPDVFLDEILRQALDNPIIYLSMKARRGERIEVGSYGENVLVTTKNRLSEEMFLHADQIIAGRNATVDRLNMQQRKEILGIESKNPIVGDKIICFKNNWNYILREGNMEIYLVNGLIGNITSIEDQARSMLYKIGFHPNFLEEESFDKLFMDKLNFMEDSIKESINEKKLYFFRKPIIDSYGVQEFKYGYCVTVHKAQGSEFDQVMLFNETLSRSMHDKWLYTGITRAKEKLILVN